MPELSDRLLSRFNAAAQDWGAATENESLPNRTLLAVRNRYYKAHRELWEYTASLERTIADLEEQVERANNRIATQ